MLFMVSLRRSPAFTLIEVLVVVAIIALLLSILLPSLKQARDMSRSVVCQANVRQLITAFVTYSIDNKGRFPGNRQDEYSDWLGGSNGPPAKRIYGVAGNRGKQPEWGTIYKKHMGGMSDAYSCPDDKTFRIRAAKGESFHSYTANLLTSGAKTEYLAGAHYPKPLTSMNPVYDRSDHTKSMGVFDHVPVIIEEHDDFFLNANVDDSGWCNEDSFADRHLRESGNKASSSIGYADGPCRPVRHDHAQSRHGTEPVHDSPRRLRPADQREMGQRQELAGRSHVCIPGLSSGRRDCHDQPPLMGQQRINRRSRRSC
jgi:prepilin-type N-terminal cleavage/methylation domain-containing protein